MTRSYVEILNAYIKEDIMKYIKCKKIPLQFRPCFTECHSSAWTRDFSGIDFMTIVRLEIHESRLKDE